MVFGAVGKLVEGSGSPEELCLPGSCLDLQLVHRMLGWLERGRRPAQEVDAELVLGAGCQLVGGSGSAAGWLDILWHLKMT